MNYLIGSDHMSPKTTEKKAGSFGSIKKPSFLKKISEDNQKKQEVKSKSLGKETYGYMGDPTLQWATGGYLRGGINLYYGPSKAGKSTIALINSGYEMQKKPEGYLVIFDSEDNYSDPFERDENGEYTTRAQRMHKRFVDTGIDPERVIVVKSNRADKLFKYLPDMEADLEKDPQSVVAFVVDSWEGIQSEQARKKIYDGDSSKSGQSFGGNSKTINPIMKVLQEFGTEYGVTTFGVQHVRVNMEEYGPKWILPGGQTFLHLNQMVMLFEGVETKKGSLVLGDEVGDSKSDSAARVGKLVKFKCEKSRANVEGRQGETYINFADAKFVKKEESLFNLATRLGVISHPVSDEGKVNIKWWCYPADAESPVKWNGAKQAIEALQGDKDLYNDVYENCINSNSRNIIIDESLGSSNVEKIVSEERATHAADEAAKNGE